MAWVTHQRQLVFSNKYGGGKLLISDSESGFLEDLDFLFLEI